MTNEEFRAELDAVKARLIPACRDTHPALVVSACMEIVMGSIMLVAEHDRDQALAATASLRPMIDHIEGQIRGSH